MAKTIKFNLICDEKPIRTLEDLWKGYREIETFHNIQMCSA